MKLRFRRFKTTDAARQFCEGKAPSDYLHEWSDYSDIPIYGTVCMLIQIKDLIEHIEFCEQEPENYNISDSEFAYLGPGPFFWSTNVIEGGRLTSKKAIASIEKYDLINARTLLSFLKVYGFYEKGKDLPYKIECALKKEYLNTSPFPGDEIRLIDEHAHPSDFSNEDALVRTLSEQFDCTPIPTNEDLGYFRFTSMKTASPVPDVPQRPKTTPRSSYDRNLYNPPMVLSARSKKILEQYDNEKQYAWLAYVEQLFYFGRYIRTPLCLGIDRESTEKEGMKLGKKGPLRRKGGNPHLEIRPLTEAAYQMLKSHDLDLEYIDSFKTPDKSSPLKYKCQFVKWRKGMPLC